VLRALCDAIRDNKGLEREGLFRHSARKEDVDALRAQLDAHSYEIKVAGGGEGIDVVAAVLKAWLRELTEPVVPTEMYQQCLDLAKKEQYANGQSASPLVGLARTH
jgi:hypothetical protein